jgi:hypothetical protein
MHQSLSLNTLVHDLTITLQVPVLETPDGPVFESNAIARYGIYTHTFPV